MIKPSATDFANRSRACASANSILIDQKTVEQIQELYDHGLMLQAYEVAQTVGPLHCWSGKATPLLASRLASNLGAPRLSAVLCWRAWRENKFDPDLAAYRCYDLLNRRGPLVALRFLEAFEERKPEVSAQARVEFDLARVVVAANLHDFSTAESGLDRAAKVAGDLPWLATVQAHVLEKQDRYPESLAAARRALDLRPWYRPGVQATAHALQLLDRDEEALELLQEAMRHLENTFIARQLSLLQLEFGCYADAAASLSRSEALAPLLERRERQWFRRQRVLLAMLNGDNAGALAQAQEVEDPFHRELVQRLQSGTPHQWVRHQVPFVRQHERTCAPATLSAVCRFWNQPVEHLELAEAICYDGTPAHSERAWAEAHGWIVREFTVTWAVAVALLDRGLPFTLTTTEATSGHLQAVVGYDKLRRTLWIQDPFIYYTGEHWVDPLLERYQATGPRGMVLVPQSRRELLEAIEFPDGGLYDQLHQVQHALAQHQRDVAVRVCNSMQAAAPKHRLTLTACRAIAAYDGNRPAMLRWLEALLEQYPEDGNLNLCKIVCLRELARRQERLEVLEQLCQKRGIDPIFWQQYALELRADAREHETAASWVRWALRYRPIDPDLVSAWAELLWDRGEFENAGRCFYLAACLGDKREPLARNFLLASVHLRRTEPGLEFLRERQRRLGAKSADPAMTLISSLQQFGRTTEAIETLENAFSQRPEDGALRLFGADLYGRFGQFDKAALCLQQAQGRCSPAAWNRAAALLAYYRTDKPAALGHWREVIQLEPLAHDAIRAVALLLAEIEGRPVALRFLDELCVNYPFSCPLLALRFEWLRAEGALAAMAPLRQLLEVNPADAWAWRELALQLEAAGKAEEALRAAEEAIRLEPSRPYGYCTRGDLLLKRGLIDAARADFGAAIRLEVDTGFAVVHYVASAPTLLERTAALAFIAAELKRQVIFNEALAAYQEAARGVLPPEQVLNLLREAHAARPDLWQAWSVLVQQLIVVGQHEEALQRAREATQRFPLLARAWLDLAQAERARLDVPGEMAALERAFELSPADATTARQLAEIYIRQGELSKARTFTERAIAAAPLDPYNYGGLAQVLWKQGRREEAIERIRHALRLEPGYQWGWNALRRWEAELGRPGLALELARDLTARRAGEARSWLLLAQCLSPREAPEELFAALDQALRLNPRCEDAFAQRAEALAQLDRFDEALAACAPPALSPLPVGLLVQAAWVEAQRGNLAQAIAKAKAALAEHPHYYLGWQLLADWHLQTQDLKAAVLSAEKMAGLAPLNPVPLGYVGDLKLRQDDQEGAREVFERAFSLDPDYDYAGFQLFNLQLADKHFDAAKKTLSILGRHGEDARHQACAVKLALARDEIERAKDLFRNLCAGEETTEWAIATAAEALDRRGCRQSVDDIADATSRAAAPPPVCACFWVDRQIAGNHWLDRLVARNHGRVRRRLARLTTQNEAGRLAVLHYLDHLGRAFRSASQQHDYSTFLWLRFHFWRLLKIHRNWLQADLQGWGKVGYVLACIGDPKPVIKWLANWKQRANAESWMLSNLVIMLHRLERYTEALEVIRHALTLRHSPELFQQFCIWAAFEEGLEGHLPVARRLLAAVVAQTIPADLKPVQNLAQLLVEVRDEATSGKAPSSREIRLRLKLALNNVPPRFARPYVRAGYYRFLRVVSRELRRPGLRFWG